MKLIIEIPNEMYECVQNGTYCGTLYEELKNGTPLSESEDCVSRQAVLEAIDAKAWEFCDYLISEGRNDEQKPVSHFADNLRECISEDLPPVTPAEKVGQWEQFGNFWEDKFKCSECGKEQPKILCGERIIGHWSDYCPYCGAEMQASPTGAESEVQNADSN